MSDRTWQPNELRISDEMVRRSAEVLMSVLPDDWINDMTIDDFGDDALRIVTAALRDSRWEDG